MATDETRLIVSLEAKLTSFERALAKATGVADRRSRSIERRFKKMNANVSASFAKLGATVAAGFSIKKLGELVNEAQKVENALKVAGLSGVELQRVYDQLFASAQRAGVPFESLVTVFSQLTLAQDTLHASMDELVQLTDSVALALRASGKSASEAQGALLQFEQMLSSGTVRAQEFNSVMQNARPILQAAAAGLQEAHGSVAELHHLVLEGKVSSEAFFRAMEAGRPVLEEKVAGAALTLSGKLETLYNALIKSTGQIDKATGLSEALGTVLDDAAENVQNTGDVFEANARRIALAWDVISNAVTFNLSAAKAALAQLDEALFDSNLAAFPRNFAEGMTRAQAAAESGVAGIKPVSLGDFAPPTKKDAASGASKRSGLDSEVQRLEKQTALLQAETTARAQLNPLVADYAAQVEKAVTVQRLLEAAQADGVKITPELKAKFETLAGTYATAAAEADRLAESQDQLRANAEEMRELGRDVMGGFISDLREGTSAADALANSLNKIGDKLFDLALDQIFGGRGNAGLLGGTGGGLLGGSIIPGILHSGGVAGRDGYGHGRAVSPATFAGAPRYHNGGIAGLTPNEVPAILQKGEVVLPTMPKVVSPGATSAGAPVNVVTNVSIDASNATPEAVGKLNSETVPQIRQIVRAEIVNVFDRKARFSRSGI